MVLTPRTTRRQHGSAHGRTTQKHNASYWWRVEAQKCRLYLYQLTSFPDVQHTMIIAQSDANAWLTLVHRLQCSAAQETFQPRPLSSHTPYTSIHAYTRTSSFITNTSLSINTQSNKVLHKRDIYTYYAVSIAYSTLHCVIVIISNYEFHSRHLAEVNDRNTPCPMSYTTCNYAS